ncbi:hypothetical protein [Halococcus saccharolyticus]|uniref:HNH endonuclease n=1 Tax=Halococcus saccharolyticus DSM 5350 TaxID=1227455 RepID=M0MQV8_9EURY|nr:hypothetical protein [Halococcus saccharolyticus]EMA47991.1 HNH endonuclease [Halococcus saccharolyticus DSM 5350]
MTEYDADDNSTDGEGYECLDCGREFPSNRSRAMHGNKSDCDVCAPWDSEKLLREAYIEERMSINEIAAHWDASYTAIQGGLDKNDINRRGHGWRESTIEEKKAAPEYDNGHLLWELFINRQKTLQEIANEAGCCRQTIRSRLREHDIGGEDYRKPQNPGGYEILDNPEEMERLYVGKKHSINTIAEDLGFSFSTVRQALLSHGIETRSDTAHIGEGEDNPRWQGGKAEIECEQCGKIEPVKPARLGRARFCSRGCKDRWQSENVFGQDHHQWRGGYCTREAVKKLIRAETWETQTAPRIRERDNHECQVCGKHTSEQDRALTVNHLPALLDGGCNNDDVLFTVCDECHHKAEAYVRALPEVDLLLRDWTDDELPGGRERWTPPEDPTPTPEQSTFAAFADD